MQHFPYLPGFSLSLSLHSSFSFSDLQLVFFFFFFSFFLFLSFFLSYFFIFKSLGKLNIHRAFEMVGESRKWMILIVSTWIQAFTGTNFDFSTYSSKLKSVLEISQVQLNYLSVASDMGKALGWCCGVCLMYFPLWVVLFMATFLGLFGYGFQWLVIQKLIVLPYFLVSL